MEKAIADSLKKKVSELEEQLLKSQKTLARSKKMDDFDSFL